MIAKIAVSAANFAIDKPYSYFIPEEMGIRPGMRCSAPGLFCFSVLMQKLSQPKIYRRLKHI